MLVPFLLHWATTALALWAASHVFKGMRFDDGASLWVSALLLGFVNAIVRPMLILLTLPLTFLTFGLFLLVINALMILLVSKWVKGFKVADFWTALGASIFMALLSMFLGSMFFPMGHHSGFIHMPMGAPWI